MIQTFIIMRHADAGPYHFDDHARALSDKGIMQAKAARDEFKKRVAAGVSDIKILVSDATRAKQTAEIVFGDMAPLQLERGIYDSHDHRELLLFLQEHYDIQKHSYVVIVGHNPTLSDLVSYLTDRQIGLSTSEFVMLSPINSDPDLQFELSGQWRSVVL